MLTAALIVGGIGLVACIVGGVLLYVSRQGERRAAAMRDAPTLSAAALGEVPTGATVEVKGTLRSAEPLTSELAGRPCAYYSASVTREYEVQDRDARGDRRTERRSETLASNTQSTPFFVEDGSGRVRVDPQGADVDAMTVFDRFEEAPPGPSLRLGGVSVRFSGARDTLGFRHSETILPVDAPVYVLGTLHEDRSIGAPPDGANQRFIVSYRSEEVLEQAATAESRWLRFGGTVTLAFGAILLVIAALLLFLRA